MTVTSENGVDAQAVGGEMRALANQRWWVDILKVVSDPLRLLALLALIGFATFTSIILGTDLTDGLQPHQRFYIILIPGSVFIGIIAIVGFYIIRGGTAPTRVPEDTIGHQGRNTSEAENRIEIGRYLLDLYTENPILQSPLPLMVMTAPDMVVRAVSPSAMTFFGFMDDAQYDKVVGKDISEITDAMKDYMDPPSAFWADLGADQERVINDIISERIAYARVPIRLNSIHPAYPNKTFIPLITERRTVERTDDGQMILRVLYLDIERLPTQVVWENALSPFDSKELADELKKIEAVFERRLFNEDDQGKLRCDSLKAAIEKLEEGRSPAVLDDLSKTGWFELQDTASKMQPPPQKVLNLIHSVLG